MQYRYPYLYKWLFPQLEWEVRTSRKELFLTFDDGPHPEVTRFVTQTLEQFEAKGTFFCVGENVEKYPAVYNSLNSKGHRTANHTFNHLNGWKVSRTTYFQNVEKCRKVVDSELFRPPYGKITPRQIGHLKKTYRIIMWSVLSNDWNQSLDRQVCLQKTIAHTKPGSIVVFHDSEKAYRNLEYVLPRFLEYFRSRKYVFNTL